MKIQEILFQNHNVFNDLKLSLEPPISLIIWENWTGKSMLLEDIIEYLYSFMKDNNSRYIKINDTNKELDKGFRLIYYYAGHNNRMNLFFEHYEKEYILKYLLKGNLIPKQFFLYKDIYFEFILIALVIIQQKNLNQGIEIYDLKQFEWARELSPITRFFSENNFWINWFKIIDNISLFIDPSSRKKIYKREKWAEGILKDVIEILNIPTNNTLIKQLQISDFLELYEKGICRDWDFEIFEILDALYINNIISEKWISLSIMYQWKTINSKDLSEGERQKFWLLMLIEYMSRQWDAIHLYDEPDTFLHPNRQLSFLDEIKKQFPIHWWSQAIITTHSPLLVWSIEDVDIIWLWKDGVICSTNHELNWWKKIDVYGNRAEFIYKEVFWLEDTRAKYLYDKAKLLHEIIQKENISDLEANQVKEIKTEIKNRLKDDVNDELLSYLDLDDVFEILKTKKWER